MERLLTERWEGLSAKVILSVWNLFFVQHFFLLAGVQSDPLCGESDGQGVDALNLAACHACVLVSETSCEKRNTLLDRGLVTGSPDDPASGFFSEILGQLE